jgi:Cdc6-like AAA superfamily ATPase
MAGLGTADVALALERLGKAFTPHRPIDLPEFLAGRLEVLYKAMDAVNTTGLHVILYGDRGTGKTSIARVLARMIQEPDRRDGRRVLMASCATSDTYASIWHKVFQEIWLAERQLGFGEAAALQVTGRLKLDEPVADPNDLRLLIESLPNPYLIVIDEFDRVPLETDARRLMADTIKLFSDTDVQSKIMIVGVAESIAELIGEHPSISRNIAEILVEPMTGAELREIIKRGFEIVGLSFEEGLDERIADLSQGYPAYAHLLGLWSGRRAVELGDSTVAQAHLDASIPAALVNATGGVQHAYETAVASSQTNNLFRQVLLACAMAPKDALGRFKALDLRGPLHTITGKYYDTGAYQSHLAKFCEADRGPVLRKTGRRRNYRWQFVDPQIIPFIRLRGLMPGDSVA